MVAGRKVGERSIFSAPPDYTGGKAQPCNKARILEFTLGTNEGRLGEAAGGNEGMGEIEVRKLPEMGD